MSGNGSSEPDADVVQPHASDTSSPPPLLQNDAGLATPSSSPQSRNTNIAEHPAPTPRSSKTTTRAPRPPSLLSIASPSRAITAPPALISNQNTNSNSAQHDTNADSDREDNDQDDDDDDEEPEPSLKYQRLKHSLTDILKKDSVSMFTTSQQFLAIGTHAGMVFILDLSGDLIKGFRSHSASVLDLDIDSTQEFVAAAGMDGILSVSALSSAEHYAFDFKRPMRAVSLEPQFGRRNSRAFVCGGMAGAFIHREKGWLGHKETVLHAGEGPIWCCKWRANLIAWANDSGVRIYDTNTRQKITFITAPSGQSRGDLYRCNLFWQSDRTLIIAWANQIKIAHVKEKGAAGQSSTSPSQETSQSLQLYVQVTKVFELDCLISGIAPYGSDLLVLCYILDDEDDDSDDSEHSEGESDLDSDRKSRRRRPGRRRLAQRPELRIIDPNTGDEKSSDVLSLANYERLHCNDYRLVPSQEVKGTKATTEPMFYVVSPQDVILARPRDEKDHIDWLLEHKKYEAALHRIEAMGGQAAQAAGFDSHSIGRQWLDYLIDDLEEYETAAKVCTSILGRDSKAWEEWAFLFLQRGQLDKLVDYIPIDDPTLSTDVYDMVLVHFLHANIVRLQEIIGTWPPEIYSAQAVSLAIEDRLQTSPTTTLKVQQPWTVKTDEEQTLLMNILAELYVKNRQPGKALPYYLRLKRSGVFDLIRENNLLMDVRDRARQLIEFEEAVREENGDMRPGQAIQLLVDNVYSIPVQRVVAQLGHKTKYLHQYLDALFQTESQLVAEYSDLQVELYAEFEPEKLMHYLRAMSSYYSFEKAFKVCEHHDYVPEQVFLLGRVGDNKRALNLIISRLQNVALAIEFAKEQNDDELWEDLLRYSETRPDFIKGLLENVGAEIDPIRLIRRIRDGLEIPGLKDALIKTLSDFNLQISLLEGCVGILESDVARLSQMRLQGQTRAQFYDVSDAIHHHLHVGEDVASVCAFCKRELWKQPNGSARQSVPDVLLPRVLFLCGHAYHLTCLLGKPLESLPSWIQSSLCKDSQSEPSAVKVTTTQRISTRRLAGGEVAQADESDEYGPTSRARQYTTDLQRRLGWSNRLRVMVKAQGGCVECRKARGGQM